MSVLSGGLDLPSGLRRSARILGSGGLMQMALTDWLVILMTWLTVAMLRLSLADSFPHSLIAAVEIFAILVIAGRFHALGVILHDAVHSRQASRDAGIFFKVLCAYPIATTLEAMKFHHLRHHRLYGTDQDPYLKRESAQLGATSGWVNSILVTIAKGSVLVPVWIVRPVVGVVAKYSLGVRRFYRRALLQDRRTEEQDGGQSVEISACSSAEYGQLLFWLLFAAGIFVLTTISDLKFADVFRFYFVPLWLAGLINVWRVLLEHDHSYRRRSDAAQDLDAVANTTRTLSVRGFNWLLAPRNIGFHQVHHLYPGVRLQNLPLIHKRLFSRSSAPSWNPGVVEDPMTSIPIGESAN